MTTATAFSRTILRNVRKQLWRTPVSLPDPTLLYLLDESDNLLTDENDNILSE